MPERGEGARMLDARAFLLDALRRISAGGDLSNDELLRAVPDPATLNKIEQEAWYRLSHWADDGDIRARDPDYRDMQEQQIADALADLEAVEAGFLPSEIGRGENSAWHIPLRSCLVVLGVVSVAIYLIISAI